MNEKLSHKEAFEYYYNLGDKRSIEAVANEYKKAVKTIYKWSTTFKWKERVKERDELIGQKMAESNIKRVVEARETFLNILELTVQNYAKNLAIGEVNIKSGFEIVKVMDKYMELLGEGKENKTEININTGVTEEDREAIKKLTSNIGNMMKEIEEEEE